MSIVENAIALHSRLLNLPRRAGLSPYQYTVRVIRSYLPEQAIVPVDLITEISPNPCVMPVPIRLIGSVLADSVTVTEQDFVIKDLMQSYTEQDLRGEWEINGVRGFRLVRLVPKTTTWEAIVASPLDRGFYGTYPNL